MIPLVRRSIRDAIRLVVAVACCAGIWFSLRVARADYQFQKDTEQSVRSAIRLVPDEWEYYMRLAQFDRAHAREFLTTSAQLNPYDAQAEIELGLEYEAEGNLGLAEKHLLQAYNVDHTYLPRWSLANFYFRQDNIQSFWTWARSAAAMPSEDVGSLFDLCWRVSPDPAKIAAAILNDKPELLRQFVPFLLAKDRPEATTDAALRLVRAGDPQTDRPLLFSVVDRLIATDQAVSAGLLWRSLIDRNWVIADISKPNNNAFQRPPLPVGFDWSLPEYPGLHSWPGNSGLETEFSGSQPEECTVAEQAVVLTPGNYTLNYNYRTSDIPPATGIRWQILGLKSNAVLGESADLSSSSPKRATLNFSVPDGTSIIRLRLMYRRALGTTRISGILDLQSTQIQIHPNS